MKSLATSKQIDEVLELKIGVIYSRDFNDGSEVLVTGALKKLKELDVKDDNIYVESICCLSQLPLATKRFIEILKSRSVHLQAAIVIGVIKNETIHNIQYTSGGIRDSLQKLQYDINIPIISGIIDNYNAEFLSAMELPETADNLGELWADAAVEMVDKFYTF